MIDPNILERDDKLDTFISQAVLNRVSGDWAFFVSRKISNRAGRMIGVVSVGVESRLFSDFFARAQQLQRTFITLYRNDGAILSHSPVATHVPGCRRAPSSRPRSSSSAAMLRRAATPITPT